MQAAQHALRWSANGCPARKSRRRRLAVAERLLVEALEKKPRASPNTLGSRISTSGMRGRE